MSNITPNQSLENLHREVEGLVDDTALKEQLKNVKVEECKDAKNTPETILDAIETIVNNISSTKYLFSILLACCIKKLISPAQDIRIGQENMPGGYSNRSFDQINVTPFLKRHNYTHCQHSGLESGRQFERPLIWDLNFPAKPRGSGTRESFLGILNYIQEQNGDPRNVAAYLLYYDKLQFTAQPTVAVVPRETNISTIMKILETHFKNSSGQGKSRLPVLALYSIYEELVKETKRFEGCILLPLERHTTADLRSGAIGDIQINKNDEPFEGIEIKSEISITADMVDELLRKFEGRDVSRYYILTTAPEQIKDEDQESVSQSIGKIGSQTGTQIICNGLIPTLWYYLRLLSDPSRILSTYGVLLTTDEDIRQGMRKTWNEIIANEYA